MGITGLLFKQIIVMFVLMGIGFIFYRKKLVSDQGSKDLGKLLLFLVLPSVIINNFCVERTAEKVTEFIDSSLIALVCMIIALVISWIVFEKKDPVAAFSSTFSNCGFIGIPLVSATLGPQAVFSISTMVILVNVLQWTVGVYMMTKDPSYIQPKKIIAMPIVIAVIIGLVIFTVQIPVPQTVRSILTTITAMNTPLAMIISGIYLAQSDLLAMLKKTGTYVVCLFRLVIVPLISLLVVWLLPFGTTMTKLAVLISAAAPVGSNVAIFAQNYGCDYTEAVEHVCVSTVLCLVTLPAIMFIAERLF